MTPEFLELAEVLEMHAAQLEAFGGLLESALAQPSVPRLNSSSMRT